MNVSEIKKLAKELQDYTRVVGSHNKHIQIVANRLVELTDQPQLNKNQKIVLDYLKSMCPPKLGVSAMVTVYCLVDDNINDNWQEHSEGIPEHIEALQKLSIAEENQVLAAFAEEVK